MIETALKFAHSGMPVFPVAENGKAPHPMASNGVKDATTKTEQVEKWWDRAPNANVGFATGSIFVIDVDVDEEKDGRVAWKQLCEEEGGAPTTTTVETPSGGMHLYFRAPEGMTIKNSVSDLAEGVDVRGHGGYVIVPPSSTESGSYSFAIEEGAAEAPFWLLDAVRKPERDTADEVPEEIEEAPDKIPKGKRNDRLTSLAGYVRRKGMGPDEMLSFLTAVNESRCEPPVPEKEVRSIVESVSRYEPSDALQATADGAEPSEEYREKARRLVAALYAAPHHGPLVRGSLPEPDDLPAPYGKVLGELLDHGLGEGNLDRASVDVRLNGQLDEVKDPEGFDAAQFRDKDSPSQLIAWADSLKNRDTNAGMASTLRAVASRIENDDRHPDESVSEVLSRIREHASDETAQMTPISDAAQYALTTVAEWKEGVTADRLATWPSVDDKIGGLEVGQMTVMAGFTSGFKTASLVDLAKRVALRHEDEEVAIPLFSAEMDAEDLTHRMAANISNVSKQTLRPDRNGNVTATEEQFRAYEDALQEVSNLNIEVDEHPNPSYERMLSHCLQIQAEQEIAFVGFDYIEKMDESGDTEELRVSQIAQNLKALAKRLDVPVVTLSQYSRQHSPHTQLPQNHYLRYSGKIEQEAQTIIHWYYPKYFVDRGVDAGAVKKYDPQDEKAIYAVIGKNRETGIPNAKLHVNESTGRFLDKYDEDQPSPQPNDKAPF